MQIEAFGTRVQGAEHVAMEPLLARRWSRGRDMPLMKAQDAFETAVGRGQECPAQATCRVVRPRYDRFT